MTNDVVTADRKFVLNVLPAADELPRGTKIIVERATNRVIDGHHRAVVIQATLGGVPENYIMWA